MDWYYILMGDLASDQDEPTEEERAELAEYEARRFEDKRTAPTEEGY